MKGAKYIPQENYMKNMGKNNLMPLMRSGIVYMGTTMILI
jgi:hypothetical protein